MRSPARLPSIAAPSVPDDITFDLKNRGKKSGTAEALADRLHLGVAQLNPQLHPKAALAGWHQVRAVQPKIIRLQPLASPATL